MRLVPLSALALATTLACAGPVAAADAERGRVLYESRCGECHAQSVHGRDKRVARDFEAVRGWVRRWSANLGLQWTDGEIADVAAHLNARYYHFACPPEDCQATGSRDTGANRLALDDRSR
jgi:mono/diheme cytochrome c family protein